MNSQIGKRLLSASSGAEVNQIRGLYTCLNLVHLSQLHYPLFLLPQHEQHLVKKGIEEICRQYSSEHISKDSLCLSQEHLIEESYFPSEFKVWAQLQKNKQTVLQCLGNYNNYFRFSFLANSCFLDYYRSALLCFG
jgi:hypothetical protein